MYKNLIYPYFRSEDDGRRSHCRFEIVFNILRNYNMKYNSTKCAFGVSSSNFLGHIVS